MANDEVLKKFYDRINKKDKALQSETEELVKEINDNTVIMIDKIKIKYFLKQMEDLFDDYKEYITMGGYTNDLGDYDDTDYDIPDEPDIVETNKQIERVPQQDYTIEEKEEMYKDWFKEKPEELPKKGDNLCWGRFVKFNPHLKIEEGDYDRFKKIKKSENSKNKENKANPNKNQTEPDEEYEKNHYSEEVNDILEEHNGQY